MAEIITQVEAGFKLAWVITLRKTMKMCFMRDKIRLVKKMKKKGLLTKKKLLTKQNKIGKWLDLKARKA